MFFNAYLLAFAFSVAFLGKLVGGKWRYLRCSLKECRFLLTTTLFMPLELLVQVTNLITIRFGLFGYGVSFVLQWYDVVQEVLDAKAEEKTASLSKKKKNNDDDDEKSDEEKDIEKKKK